MAKGPRSRCVAHNAMADSSKITVAISRCPKANATQITSGKKANASGKLRSWGIGMSPKTNKPIPASTSTTAAA